MYFPLNRSRDTSGTERTLEGSTDHRILGSCQLLPEPNPYRRAPKLVSRGAPVTQLLLGHEHSQLCWLCCSSVSSHIRCLSHVYPVPPDSGADWHQSAAHLARSSLSSWAIPSGASCCKKFTWISLQVHMHVDSRCSLVDVHFPLIHYFIFIVSVSLTVNNIPKVLNRKF